MQLTPLFLSILACISPATAQTATVASSLPSQTAQALFDRQVGTNAVSGSIIFSALDTGSVGISTNLDGLPSSGGPFSYHVHEAPVPASGNCSGTLGHLDPSHRGDLPPCNNQDKGTCQVGDLSGKYGKINGTSYQTRYEDSFLSFGVDSPNYFVGKSVTFHFANSTRIACANITLLSGIDNGTNPKNGTGVVALPTKAVGSIANTVSGHSLGLELSILVGLLTVMFA